MGPGPLGLGLMGPWPGPIWAQAHVGPGPFPFLEGTSGVKAGTFWVGKGTSGVDARTYGLGRDKNCRFGFKGEPLECLVMSN